MVKLFKAEYKHVEFHGTTAWCFAPDYDTAQKIIREKVFSGEKKRFLLKDVTKQHISEDGVKYLIDHNFVGIPETSIFMLNGCVSAQQEHYQNKHRSGVLWYSKEVPGSREIWS